MFCKYCGAEIQDGSVFCNKCGKAINATSDISQEIQQEKSSNKRITKVPIIIGATVIVLILIGIFVFNGMVGAEIVSNTVEAGSVFTTKDLVKAKSKNATVSFDGTVDVDTLGDYKIKYTIQNGMFKKTKEITVHVVDTTAPQIVGPDSVTIISGKEFVPSDYFDVEDFEANLKKDIICSIDVDTNSEGNQDVELMVKDSSGNEGKRSISVKTLKLTTNEEKVLLAINQYLADGKSKDDVLSSAWVMKTSGGTNGVDYYVEVANDVLYAIYYSGEVSEFTVSDCGGSMMHELMVYAVHYDGTTVSTSKLIN